MMSCFLLEQHLLYRHGESGHLSKWTIKYPFESNLFKEVTIHLTDYQGVPMNNWQLIVP